ncbi:peptide MFS transporter [Longispora sp. NPDC051575]|uniref:peptide MFS transporter n=1 Tax=Longispora sp. NPDC051575 TaxID=3154943 RepID=UPI0034332B5E
MSDITASAEATTDGEGFFGHPRALSTLFLTEMWERFSYYGMRALLVLYLTATVANGGLGWGDGDADALYGVYVAMVYLMALPGGWIADRLLGARRSVLWGGMIIAAGHYAMILPSVPTFFVGLALITIGTGLLKPNISAMVGKLYSPDDVRRDAGFSIFYMGINLGAFIAPLITGYLGEKVNWHIGFGVAAIGMSLGVVQYVLGRKRLHGVGDEPTNPLTPAERPAVVRWLLIGVGAVAVLLLLAALTGTLSVSRVVTGLTVFTVLVAIGYFGRIFLDKSLDSDERSRMKAYVWLFLFAAAFWLIYDQAGSVLNRFARDETDRVVFGWDMPASWLQSVNPIFVIIGSPLFAILWLKAGHRLSTPLKFSMGLVLNGVSFMLMAAAAKAAVGGNLVSPLWLVAVYALQVCGELCLSPVGLSATTKLAPAKYASQMLGLWFLSTAVGDAIGGQVAKIGENYSQPAYFMVLGVASVVLGVAAIGFTRQLHRLMRGIH